MAMGLRYLFVYLDTYLDGASLSGTLRAIYANQKSAFNETTLLEFRQPLRPNAWARTDATTDRVDRSTNRSTNAVSQCVHGQTSPAFGPKRFMGRSSHNESERHRHRHAPILC